MSSDIIKSLFGQSASEDDVAGFAKDLFVLSPLAFGAAAGYSSIRSNSPVSRIASKVGGQDSAPSSAKVGDNLREMKSKLESSRQQVFEQIKQQLLEDQNLESLLQAEEGRKQVFAALLSQLDDQTDPGEFRNQLIEALKEVDSIDNVQLNQLKDEIATRINTIFDTGGASAENFERLFTEMGSIKNQIQAAMPIDQSVASSLINQTQVELNKVPSSASEMHKRLIKVLPQESINALKLLQVEEAGGAKSVYARVPAGSSTMTVPLHIAGVDGLKIFRTGQAMNTTYAARHAYYDAPGLVNLAEKGPITRSDLDVRAGSSGVAFGYEEAVMRELEELLKTKTNLTPADAKRLHSLSAMYGNALDRAATTVATNTDISSQLKWVAGIEASYGMAIGLEKLNRRQQQTFHADVISRAEGALLPVSGGKTEIVRNQEVGYAPRAFTQLGIAGKQNPLDLIKALGFFDGVLMPLTSRPRQVFGRPEAFVEDQNASNFGRGRFRMFGDPVGIKQMPGHINIPVLMAMDSASKLLGIGEGMGYYTGKPVVRTHLPKTVMDPENLGTASTALLEDLKRGPIALNSAQDVADFFKKYSGQGSTGAILGHLDESVVSIPHYSDMIGMTLKLAEQTVTGMDRKQYHLTGHIDRRGIPGKLFGFGGKVTTIDPTSTGLDELFARITGSTSLDMKDLLQSTNVDSGNLMINTGDMMKKSPYYLANQILSSISLFKDISHEDIWKQADKAIQRGIPNYKRMDSKQAQQEFIEQVIKFAINRTRDLPAEQQGLVFGAAHSILGEGPLSGLSDEALVHARKGLAMGVFSFSSGTPASTMRSTMSSMEPRSYQFLQHRLTNVLGLSRNEVADFMTAFLSRKVGVEDELTALKGLIHSVESMAGMRNVIDDPAKGLERIGVQEFIAGVGGSEESARKFLEQHEKGFMLDFSQAGEKVKGMLPRHFSGATEIFIPGSETTSAFSGTKIIKPGETMTIEHALINRTKDFADALSILSSVGAGSSEKQLAEAQDRAGQFRESIGEIFGQTWRGVLAGKLRGSTLALGAGLTLGQDNTVGFTPQQNRAMRAVFSKTGGQAVFVDAQAFVDSMRGYSDAAKREALGTSRPASSVVNEAGNLFRSFFLGMEGGSTIGYREGVSTLVKRDPQVGPAHIAQARIYRSDANKGSSDKVFASFADFLETVDNDPLSELRALTGESISSFGDIARVASQVTPDANENKMIQRIFGLMASNISSYMGEGGGKVWFPDMIANVHFTGSSEVMEINLSRAAGMIGDHDGDYYQVMPFSEVRHSSVFDANALERSFEFDLKFAARTHIFTEEVKKGLKAFQDSSSTPGALSQLDFKYEEQLKEYYAKDIGPLNVSLDSLRMGLANAADTDSAAGRSLVNRALALLTAIQEVQIKGKKLERAAQFSSILNKALHQGIGSGGEDVEYLRQIFEQVIFKDSPLLDGRGLEVDRVDLPNYSSASLKGTVARAISEGAESNFEEVWDFLRKGFAAVKEVGFEKVATVVRASKLHTMRGSARDAAWKQIFYNTQDVRGGLIRGEEDVLGQTNQLLAELERHGRAMSDQVQSKLLRPLAFGAAGALALGTIVGSAGYRPQPLIMPGEVSDQRVNAALSAGALEQQRDHRPIEMAHQTPAIDLVNRPINRQEAYFGETNPYRITGRVSNPDALGVLTSTISRFGTSTSVRVNDTRLPITPNYIDRILGD